MLCTPLSCILFSLVLFLVLLGGNATLVVANVLTCNKLPHIPACNKPFHIPACN
jgi:hypothetical protein